ncbi:MAG: hypothetical protein V2A74_13165 [bacterium]
MVPPQINVEHLPRAASSRDDLLAVAETGGCRRGSGLFALVIGRSRAIKVRAKRDRQLRPLAC